MDFPFGHLTERTDHGEAHHGACFGVNDFVAPTEPLAPGGHRLLKRSGEIICGGEVLLHVFRAECELALRQSGLEEVVIHGYAPFVSEKGKYACSAHCLATASRSAQPMKPSKLRSMCSVSDVGP